MTREWIAVAGKLPEDGQWVEVWMDHLDRPNYARFYKSDACAADEKGIFYGQRIGSVACFPVGDGKITHWRPKAPAPQPELVANNTCDAKHTEFQPTEDEWRCPKCGSGNDHFYVYESPAEDTCPLLHDDDYVVCDLCKGAWDGSSIADLMQQKISKLQVSVDLEKDNA